MHKKLFIPGPIEVSPEILNAMATPMIGHRMPEYAALHKGVTDKLKRLMFTEERVFLATSSAFGAMTEQTISSSGSRIVTPAGATRSLTWMESPTSSALMSASM